MKKLVKRAALICLICMLTALLGACKTVPAPAETTEPVAETTPEPEPIIGITQAPAVETTEPTTEPTVAPTLLPGEHTDPIKSSKNVETITVKELTAAIDAKETFVVFFGFENCPFCRLASPVLTEAAEANGQTVRFIDTRAKPEWKTNMDIDDYELVVEYLGDYIPLDDEGLKHLYVPHVFFIRAGKVVAQYQGIGEDFTAGDELTPALRMELLNTYQHGFQCLRED